MTLTYEVGSGLYVNVTNKCPCNCTFCIRNNGDGAYGSDPLWLEHQPSADELIDSIKTRDLSKYTEVVFCGYGEPTERLPELLRLDRTLQLNNGKQLKTMQYRELKQKELLRK